MALRSRCTQCNKVKFWFSMKTASLCRDCSDKNLAAQLVAEKEEQKRQAVRNCVEALKRYQAASATCISVDTSVVESLRKSYIAFDIETTGLDASNDRIVELGATLFTDGVPVKTFSSLVNAGVSVSYSAYAVNHISDEMLQSAPTEDEVYPKFIEFLGSAISGDIIMCAHNARFDFNFLRNTFCRLGYESNIQYVDTLSLARRCIDDLPNYKQPTLVKYFRLQSDEAHRAASDAKNCGEILRELLNRVDEVLAKDLRRESINKWNQSALQYWDQGEFARKNGLFGEAFALYDKAKAFAGAPSYLYESYAMAYRKLKDYEHEIEILNEGISALPPDESIHLRERRDRASSLLAAQKESARILAEKEAIRVQKEEALRRAAELAAAKPKQPAGRPVAQCTDDVTVIRTFETVSAAAKEVGVSTKGIRSAASGEQKHSGGFCWKYLDSKSVP